MPLDEQSAAATDGLPPGGAAPPVGAGVAPAVTERRGRI